MFVTLWVVSSAVGAAVALGKPATRVERDRASNFPIYFFIGGGALLSQWLTGRLGPGLGWGLVALITWALIDHLRHARARARAERAAREPLPTDPTRTDEDA